MLLRTDLTSHRLKKEYKKDGEASDPLKDCKETKKLFEDLNKKFENLDEDLRYIFVYLLKDDEHFRAYFEYKNCVGNLNFEPSEIAKFLQEYLQENRKESYGLKEISKELLLEYIKKSPLELALALAYSGIKQPAKALPPAILELFPKITKEKIFQNLNFNPESNFNISKFAKDEFNIEYFKEFDKAKIENEEFQYTNKEISKNSKISQKELIENALFGESLLAVLPTGGGKTLTFQIPALFKAKAYKALSIVISPLQALMKDQTYKFRTNKNFEVLALSSYLNPIERAEVIRSVREGKADILYLAPEALRTFSNIKLLKNRLIERIIIDEAHCFSTWGHDLRCDYWFIDKFIKELEQNPHQPKIPVSCFTATAKREVLKDIKDYYKEKLGLDLKEFIATNERKNLHYKAFKIIPKENERKKDLDKRKYDKLVEILRKENQNSKKATIIYIPQNARACADLAQKLQQEDRIKEFNLNIEPFYANIDKEIEQKKRIGRDKNAILNGFLENEIDIIIATTAFGMGIDKSNIELVIHFGQSESIESYMQESGRGARDKDLEANCYVLYYEDEFKDLFASNIRSRLDFGMMIKIISLLKKFRNNKEEFNINPNKIVKHLSALNSNNIFDKTMLNTALLEFEKFDILERGFNANKIFATSVSSKKGGMPEVHRILENKSEEVINKKLNLNYKQTDEELIKKYKNYIIRIMQNIIQKSKEKTIISTDDLAELALVNEKEIFITLELMQELNLIAFENDISVMVKKKIKDEVDKFFKLEKEIFKNIKEELEKQNNIINLRVLNKNLNAFMKENFKENKDAKNKENKIDLIRALIYSWKKLSDLKENFLNIRFQKNKIEISKNLEQNEVEFKKLDEKDLEMLEKMINKRKEICDFIVEYLLDLLTNSKDKDELEFSSLELKKYIEKKIKSKFRMESFHYILVYLNDLLENFELRKGRLIHYSEYRIIQLPFKQRENTEQNNSYKFELSRPKPYLKGDYEKSLGNYYKNKIVSLNLLIFFLDKLAEDKEEEAFGIVKNYFTLEKKEFYDKYKELKESDLKEAITQSQRLKNKALSEEQKKIVEEKADSILVLAGPGSGKTKTLVHKIASLLTKEAYKSECFLMLTHSRTAVSEFKTRLVELLGESALSMNIMTFHAFALELLGKEISEENEFEEAINEACEALEKKTIIFPHIQMLVLDEFQDTNELFYRFIKLIYENMAEDKKIIAVGDDDQCINNFGNFKASVKFIKDFREEFIDSLNEKGEKKGAYHELLENFRSRENIVIFANLFRKEIQNSLKTKDLKAHIKKEIINQKGLVKITQYSENSLMQEHICAEILKEAKELKEKENLAILLRTNDEVVEYYSLLNELFEDSKLAFKVSYILENEGFRLGNLIELQDFLSDLKDEKFKDKKFDELYNKTKEKYANSANLELFKEVVQKFKKENDFEYSKEFIAKNFEDYLKEIEFNEFERLKTRVIVSTMHKAKGKEFDKVFVCVNENFMQDENENFIQNEYDKRLFYVALTRAKLALHIHSKDKNLNEILSKADFANFPKEYFDKINSNKAQKRSFMMSLKDIDLGSKDRYADIKENIETLKQQNKMPLAGEKLWLGKEILYIHKPDSKIKTFLYYNYKGDKKIACLSNEFADKIWDYLDKDKKGYSLDKVEIKYVVKWKDAEQFLCFVCMSKKA